MAEATPFLRKYDITFLCPRPIAVGRVSADLTAAHGEFTDAADAVAHIHTAAASGGRVPCDLAAEHIERAALYLHAALTILAHLDDLALTAAVAERERLALLDGDDGFGTIFRARDSVAVQAEHYVLRASKGKAVAGRPDFLRQIAIISTLRVAIVRHKLKIVCRADGRPRHIFPP